MLEYLHTAGFHAAFDALKSDAALDSYEPDPKGKYANLLEKKWLSTIRLQKKVCMGVGVNACVCPTFSSDVDRIWILPRK